MPVLGDEGSGESSSRGNDDVKHEVTYEVIIMKRNPYM